VFNANLIETFKEGYRQFPVVIKFLYTDYIIVADSNKPAKFEYQILTKKLHYNVVSCSVVDVPNTSIAPKLRNVDELS
jgi:hypothetical protein